MKIGLDFDNTIVCYDVAFHTAAKNRDWLSGDIEPSKQAVKQHLQDQGRNDDWTELQGFVYGPGMADAKLFPGLADFVAAVSKMGWEIFVISHRTRNPYRGPRYDLHEFAKNWIASSELFSLNPSLNHEKLFFETTKKDKLARIQSTGVDVFFDDLPEIFLHDGFPAGVEKILFDPSQANSRVSLKRIGSWRDAMEALS